MDELQKSSGIASKSDKSSSEMDSKSSEKDSKSSEKDSKSSEKDSKSSEKDSKSSEMDSESSGKKLKFAEPDTSPDRLESQQQSSQSEQSKSSSAQSYTSAHQPSKSLEGRRPTRFGYLSEPPVSPKRPRNYLVTLPGILRILEFIMTSTIIAIFAYFCTYYDLKMKDQLLPVFLTMTREMFFFLSCFASSIGNLHIFLAVLCSPTTINAVTSSIYFFLFDFSSFLMLVIGSLATTQLYTEKTMPSANSGTDVKQGCCIIGTIAGLAHLVGSAHDLVVFLRSRHHKKMERARLYPSGHV